MTYTIIVLITISCLSVENNKIRIENGGMLKPY